MKPILNLFQLLMKKSIENYFNAIISFEKIIFGIFYRRKGDGLICRPTEVKEIQMVFSIKLDPNLI